MDSKVHGGDYIGSGGSVVGSIASNGSNGRMSYEANQFMNTEYRSPYTDDLPVESWNSGGILSYK